MSLCAADDLGARDLMVVASLGTSSSLEWEMSNPSTLAMLLVQGLTVCSTMSLSTYRKVRPSNGLEDESVESTMFSTCGALGEKVQNGDLLAIGGVDS